MAGGGLRATRARAPRSPRARRAAQRDQGALLSARYRRRSPEPAGQGMRNISSRRGARGYGYGTGAAADHCVHWSRSHHTRARHRGTPTRSSAPVSLLIDPASLAQPLGVFLPVRRVSRHRIIDVIEPGCVTAGSTNCRADPVGSNSSHSPNVALALCLGEEPDTSPDTDRQERSRTSRVRPATDAAAALLGPLDSIASMMRCHVTPPDTSVVPADTRQQKRIASPAADPAAGSFVRHEPR